MTEDRNKLQNKANAAVTRKGAVELTEGDLSQVAGGATSLTQKVNKSSPDLM